MLDRPQNKHLKPVKPGEVRNPAGRPKGSRNKLSEAFLAAMADDFLQHGEGVIQKVRETRPHDYLRVIAATLPKQFEMAPPKSAEELTDAELTAIIRDGEKNQQGLNNGRLRRNVMRRSPRPR
jgi:hypothetical protein